jgi:16S rRNA processing protein RimM
LWDNADADFVVLRLDNILVPFRVTDWRGKGAESLLFTLDGISTEQRAQALVGAEARMLRRDTTGSEDSADDMLTWEDLNGYRAFTSGGADAGLIKRVDESTANILAETDKGILLPLHEDLILRLDTEKKEVQLNLPDTL